MDNHIDDITLRMFSNKKLYSKYLESAEPETVKQRNEYYDKVLKYRPRIRDIFYNYLDNPDNNDDYNMEMIQALENLTKTTIRYLEMRDLDEESTSEEDEDMMFGKIEDTSCYDKPFGKIDEKDSFDGPFGKIDEKDSFDEPRIKTTSMWGKSISKKGYRNGTIQSFFSK